MLVSAAAAASMAAAAAAVGVAADKAGPRRMLRPGRPLRRRGSTRQERAAAAASVPGGEPAAQRSPCAGPAPAPVRDVRRHLCRRGPVCADARWRQQGWLAQMLVRARPGRGENSRRELQCACGKSPRRCSRLYCFTRPSRRLRGHRAGKDLEEGAASLMFCRRGMKWCRLMRWCRSTSADEVVQTGVGL